MTRIEGLDELERELKKLNKKLSSKEVKKVFRKNSKVLIAAARLKAPKAEQNVYRYSTAKVIGKLRAPKGRGKRVATYTPGNLSRAIKNLPLRRAKKSIVIGPFRNKRGSKGLFSGRRADGYYGIMREFGTKNSRKTPFMKPAWQQTKSAVIGGILRDLKNIVEKG